MSRIRTLAILNALVLVVHIALSYASQTRLYADSTVKDISEQYPSLFTPAGITFSIWGVIYTALLALCSYHLVRAFTKREQHEANVQLSKMGLHFIINNLATIGWLIVWTKGLVAYSVIFILLQLLSLLTIHTRLGIVDRSRSGKSKVFTQFPLSVYLGWISIATIANISIYLVSVSWNGWGLAPDSWAMIMIGVAALVTVMMVLWRKNIFYGLTVIWAAYGIILKRQYAGSYENIIYAAWGAIIICSIAIAIRIYRNKQELARSV